MEAKSLELRRDRKKEIFDLSLLIRQDFEKSVLTEKVEKISPTHPRRFALQSGPPSFGLGAGNRGAIRGFSSFFRASEEKLKSKFPGNFSGEISSFGEF